MVITKLKYRIPHPTPEANPDKPGEFIGNDLFCVGHQHVRDGNVLLYGGTEYYKPWWTGALTTYLFNWTKELEIDWETVDWTELMNITDANYPYIHTGNMLWGRWYPHSVPLMDGRLVILGGLTNFDTINGPNETMYKNQMNQWMDIFDYDEFLNGVFFNLYQFY